MVAEYATGRSDADRDLTWRARLFGAGMTSRRIRASTVVVDRSKPVDIRDEVLDARLIPHSR